MGAEPPLVELLRRERADVRVHAPRLVEEDAAGWVDGRRSAEEVAESGDVGAGRVDQQPERVQGAGKRPQTVHPRGGNRVRHEQPRTRRLRRVVALVDTGADPCLLGELERRLEHVHEQARRRAQAGQRFGPGMPSRPTSRVTTAPFFCSTQAWSFFRYGLDRVSPMPCSLTEADQHLVVGVAPPEFLGVPPIPSPDLWIPMTRAEDVTPTGITTSVDPPGETLLEGRGER